MCLNFPVFSTSLMFWPKSEPYGLYKVPLSLLNVKEIQHLSSCQLWCICQLCDGRSRWQLLWHHFKFMNVGRLESSVCWMSYVCLWSAFKMIITHPKDRLFYTLPGTCLILKYNFRCWGQSFCCTLVPFRMGISREGRHWYLFEGQSLCPVESFCLLSSSDDAWMSSVL